jgi:hypothetical protein
MLAVEELNVNPPFRGKNHILKQRANYRKLAAKIIQVYFEGKSPDDSNTRRGMRMTN